MNSDVVEMPGPDCKEFYVVYDESGRAIYPTLDKLKKDTEFEVANDLTYWKVKRIVKVTCEDVELPDYVAAYNNMCEQRKKEKTT